MISTPNAYVGARAFRTGEKLYGRDRESKEIIDLLMAERIVLLYSPSGAGKTSLIRASVIPEMENEDYQVLPLCRPGATLDAKQEDTGVNPYVATTIATWEKGRTNGQPALATTPGMSLSAYLSQREWIQEDERLKLLILDQFEEILTSKSDESARIAFFQQLGEALENPRIWALLSMREEFSAVLDGYRQRLPTRLSTRFRLDLLSRDEAAKAIRNPALAASPSVSYSDKAIECLLKELGTVAERTSSGKLVFRTIPFTEPLYLQIVCNRLWSRLPAGTQDIVLHDIAGGKCGSVGNASAGAVSEALEAYCSSSIESVAKKTKVPIRRIREWLERELVTPQGLRRQVLRGQRETAGLDNVVVEALAGELLLRKESRSGVIWYEVTHDRLANIILDSNIRWFLKNLKPFQRQAAQWIRLRQAGSESAKHEILNYPELRSVEKWRKRHPGLVLTDAEEKFLSYSKSAWKNRRNRLFLIITAFVSVIAALTYWTVTVGNQERELKRWTDTVKKQREELNQEIARERSSVLLRASARQKWRTHNHELASLLAIQAYRSAPKSEQNNSWMEQMLRLALQERPFAYGYQLPHRNGPLSDGKVLLARQPDRLATALSGKKKIVLHQFKDAEETSLPITTKETIITASFLPNGEAIVVMTAKGLEFHSINKKLAVQRIKTKTIRTGLFRFSPNGLRLAVVIDQHSIRLWKLDEGNSTWRQQTTIDTSSYGKQLKITTVTLDNDGHWLAWGSRAGKVVLHNLDSRTPSAAVWAVDNTFGDWPDDLQKMLGKRKTTIDFSVNSIELLPEKGRLVAVYQQGPPRLFELSPLSGSRSNPYLMPNRDSQTALDTALKLGWATRRIVSLERFFEADLSPDERRLAVGGARGLVGLWDLNTISATADGEPEPGRIPKKSSVVYADFQQLPGLGSGVRAIRFTAPLVSSRSPAGMEQDWWLAAADARGMVRLWSLEGLHGVGYSRIDAGKKGVIYSLAFLDSPGTGHERLAFGGTNAAGVVNIRADTLSISVDDTFNGILPVRIRSLAADASGKRLLIATGDIKDKPGWLPKQFAWLLDIGTHAPTEVLALPDSHQDDGQWAAAINDDGTRLIVAGWDGRVVQWTRDQGPWQSKLLLGSASKDKQMPEDNQVLEDNQVPILAAALSPDQRDLVVTSYGGKVYLFHDSGSGFDKCKKWSFDAHTPIHAIGFNPDGQSLCEKWSFDAHTPIRAVGFSPDGKSLVAGDDDGFLWHWSISDGNYTLDQHPLPAHTGSIYAIAFGDKGDGRMVTGGADGKVNIWQPDLDSRTRLQLEGPSSEVVSVALSRSGKLVVASDAQGFIHLWKLGLPGLVDRACQAMHRNLSRKEWRDHVRTDVYQRTCPKLPKARNGLPTDRNVNAGR